MQAGKLSLAVIAILSASLAAFPAIARPGNKTACVIGEPAGPTPPLANPDMLPKGQNTTVTVTSLVPSDPNLISTSVTLLRVDSSGNLITNLGPMYDDGTHGDTNAGDGTYTTQFIFNDPIAPGELTGRSTQVYLAVKASYSGPPGCRQSNNNENQILTGKPSTPEENQIVDNVLGAGGAEYDALVGSNGPDAGNPTKARQDLVTWLKAQPGVADASIERDGVTIGVDFTSGFDGVIDTTDWASLDR